MIKGKYHNCEMGNPLNPTIRRRQYLLYGNKMINLSSDPSVMALLIFYLCLSLGG